MSNPADGPASEPAAAVVRLLTARKQTLGGAESLTGGLVAAALTGIPGASAVLRGTVVAYAADVKASVLHVPADLLGQRGAVDADVALAMALGACAVLSATYGYATTGVAGPGPAEGKPAGTVYIAVAGPGGASFRRLALTGDRQAIRMATVGSVLELLLSAAG